MTFSQNFAENTLFLLLTAGLTGVLVPLLFRLIDERKNRGQKIFEADLARQSQVIDAQVKLIENLSDFLWEYQLSLIAVTYYRQFPERNLYSASLKAYGENVGKLLGKIRAEISKALRLTPQPIYEELKELYYKQLLPLDLKLSRLAASDAKNEGKTEEWLKLNHYVVYELSENVDNIIDKLAGELKLKASKSI